MEIPFSYQFEQRVLVLILVDVCAHHRNQHNLQPCHQFQEREGLSVTRLHLMYIPSYFLLLVFADPSESILAR